MIKKIIFSLLVPTFIFSAQPLPRTIVALYDSRVYEDLWFTKIHQFAEMPLNHLGALVEYHDLRKGLPEVKEREDIIGVITWFPEYTVIDNPGDYLKWMIGLLDNGKKIVLMGTPAFYSGAYDLTTHQVNQFWNRLGLENTDEWVTKTYDIEFVLEDPYLVNFERKYLDVRPDYPIMKVIDEETKSHLIVRSEGDPETDSTLIATGKNGGFAFEGYEKFEIFNDKESFRKWYLNPFEFFRLAFGLDQLPKPDTTTLAGRRLYYSHIDGDGWNSKTELEVYRKERLLAAEVIRREVIESNKDLPVTVAAIGADLDSEWAGRPESKEIAKELFALPHVEVSSHTYSHPFDWGFFDQYHPEKEQPYLCQFEDGSWEGKGMVNKIFNMWDKWLIDKGWRKASYEECFEKEHEGEEIVRDYEAEALKDLHGSYDVPRAYAMRPFDLDLEIKGSIDLINSVAPKGKKVMLYQWSGNCQPFEAALQQTREVGVRNINGGDTRFDREFMSYAWVGSIGRKVGGQQQVYASNSNENTYTDLWTERFYGFQKLPETFQNTETPLRIKPMNVYYHMYSGVKLASLNALHQIFEFVRTLTFTPITASRFAAIGDGFFSTQFIPVGDQSWQIEDRGALQTIRFDQATLRCVDFGKSKGVIGQRRFQGSLYVYLDEANEQPVLTLKNTDVYYEEPPEELPYLIESRWRVWGVDIQENQIRFKAQGYGDGEMRWKVPGPGVYSVQISGTTTRCEAKNGEIAFILEADAIEPVNVSIE